VDDGVAADEDKVAEERGLLLREDDRGVPARVGRPEVGQDDGLSAGSELQARLVVGLVGDIVLSSPCVSAAAAMSARHFAWEMMCRPLGKPGRPLMWSPSLCVMMIVVRGREVALRIAASISVAAAADILASTAKTSFSVT
jgi:hypothetical protein